MCLILTTIAAVVSTVVWYSSAKMRDMKISVLCWLFWGAAIMWLVDLAFEYAEDGADVFNPSYKVAIAVKTVEEEDAAGQEAEAAEAKTPAAGSEAESAAVTDNAGGNMFSISIEPSDNGDVKFVLNDNAAAAPASGPEEESTATAEKATEQQYGLVVKPSRNGIAVELSHVDGILNDTVLGLAVITLALVIWIAFLLISDPKGIVRSAILKKKKS